MLDSSNKRGAVLSSAEEERSTKRRRCAMDVDALSEEFSSHVLFYKNNGAPSSLSVAAAAGMKKTGMGFICNFGINPDTFWLLTLFFIILIY